MIRDEKEYDDYPDPVEVVDTRFFSHDSAREKSRSKNNTTTGEQCSPVVVYGIRYSATPDAVRRYFFRLTNHRLPINPTSPGASRSRLGGRGTGLPVKVWFAWSKTSVGVYTAVKKTHLFR